MSHGHEEINRIVTTLPDGRTMAKGITTVPVVFPQTVTVTVPHLRYIEEIINWQWKTEGPTVNYIDLGNKHIEGNVVGITVSGDGTGTTLTLEVLAIGI